MCGIAGWVSFARDLTAERSTLAAMTATMRCRGPDAAGEWLDRHAALGHHRLAVIDLAGGAQPMTVRPPGGPVAITYSGEAYNHVELRKELRRRGHRFRTASDTEVVLRGYLEWGEEVATRLNGMYALAIWDARVERLLMVRDRLGVKPLYYHPTPDGVLFGSEPKAVLANPAARREIDLDGLRGMLLYVLTMPDAVWAGLREVTPGGVVTVDRAGLRERRYWRLETREHVDGPDATAAHVRELLDDVVRRQIVADVPYGVLLSGGLDSSTLAALAARHERAGGKRVRTFAVDFVGRTESFRPDGERAGPDAPYVRDMVAHVGSDHADVVLDHAAVADPAVRRAVVRAYDLPPGSGDRDRSLYLLFQALRRIVTVALSGETADELFGGYRSFHDPAVHAADMFPWVTACLDTYGIAPGVLLPELEGMLDLHGWLAAQYASAVAEVEQLDAASARERRMRVHCHLVLTRQLRVLLDRKDRLSMAAGLEIRVPYCDHRLVEYVYNAPWALKCFDGREKSLLRAAVRDLLPRSVLQRRKSAYPSIQDPRYLTALQQQARELLCDRGDPVFGVVDRAWLEGAARQPPAAVPARARNSLEWVLNLAAWLDVCRPRLRLG
jgi:asparagine synthase (glutamine-hydrolysing)